MKAKTAMLIVTAGLLALLAGANLATPLYAVYGERFGFQSIVLVLIFATYALVLIPSLLAFGQLSDRFGRRSVISAGLGVAIVGLVLFALADGVAWLFAARAVQGLAVGMISGAATAALVELEPHDDARRAALPATIAQAGGGAIGPLIAGMLAQWAPDPEVLPYLVGIAVTAVLAVAVLAIPEPRSERGGRWRVQRPGVPAEIRAPFARVALTAASVWSVAALFLSVIPSYAGEILETTNLALLGAITAVMLGFSCVGQVAVRRGAPPVVSLAGGLFALAVGLVGLVLASPLGAIDLLLVGAAIAGIGHGVGFLATQDELNGIAPDERRGEVNAAFYVSIYVGVSVSTIGVGVVAELASLFTGILVFAVLTGSIAVAIWHLTAERGERASRRHPLRVQRGRA